VNGIFGKVLNMASEEMILELITTQCMYADSFIRLTATYILDFACNRKCMNYLKVHNVELIKECRSYFR